MIITHTFSNTWRSMSSAFADFTPKLSSKIRSCSSSIESLAHAAESPNLAYETDYIWIIFQHQNLTAFNFSFNFIFVFTRTSCDFAEPGKGNRRRFSGFPERTSCGVFLCFCFVVRALCIRFNATSSRGVTVVLLAQD